MQLQSINKKRYRKHFNYVIAFSIVFLSVVSISLSALMIAGWSEEGESNFIFNLAGVVIAAVLLGGIIHRFKTHDFFTEIVYVWRLKQSINKIFRKLRKIRPEAEQNQPEALTILFYYLHASKQLYQLDDNTITMDELEQELQLLNEQIESLGLQIAVEDYREDMLQTFSAG